MSVRYEANPMFVLQMYCPACLFFALYGWLNIPKSSKLKLAFFPSKKGQTQLPTPTFELTVITNDTNCYFFELLSDILINSFAYCC